MLNEVKNLRAGMMAKVGYPFRTIEREFEFVDVRYCPQMKKLRNHIHCLNFTTCRW